MIERRIRPLVLEALRDTRVVMVMGGPLPRHVSWVRRSAGGRLPPGSPRAAIPRRLGAPAVVETAGSRTTSQRHSSWSDVDPRVYHFRDRRGAEVDLVLEDRSGRVAGIEIKAKASPTQADTRSLVKIRDALGDRFAGGAVICTAEQLSFRHLPSGRLPRRSSSARLPWVQRRWCLQVRPSVPGERLISCGMR